MVVHLPRWTIPLCMGAIIVAGVPGVGKSTLAERASQRSGFPLIPFGSVMFRVALARGLVKHRDEMRRLTPEEQFDVQKVAATAVTSRGTCILDTNLTIQTPQGFLAGFPSTILQNLRPSRFILVEARPAEVLARRARSSDRQHDQENPEEIEVAQALNRAVAMACSTLAGATVKIVFNHDGRVEECVQQMLTALQGVARPVPRLVAYDPFLADETPST